MKCSIEITCDNPKLETVDNQFFALIVMEHMKKV